jgi:hypothetical protein
MWTNLVLQVFTCTRKEGKKYQTNKRNTSNTNVHKHKQCKEEQKQHEKNKNKQNKQTKLERKKLTFFL